MLALAVLIFLLPPEIVLPLFSVAALAGAAIVALAALVAPRFAALKPVNAWDVAGALTLIGCAAAILGEIEPLLEYLKPMPERSNARG
ncbi:MAG: hypothetical protein WC670_03295 [Pseudolabrys sp.]